MAGPVPVAVLFCLAQLFPLSRSQSRTDVSLRVTGKRPDSQTGQKPLAPNVVVRVLGDGKNEHDENSLSCYACSYESDGKGCKDAVNRSLFSMSRCPNKDYVCQVWHFFSANPDEKATYYFERGCAESCQPGCTSLDDMEHRFVSCFSCCAKSLCNTDNGASASAMTLSLSRLVLSLVMFWVCKSVR